MAQTVICKMPFAETKRLLESKYAGLAENGTFYLLFSTEYDADGNVRHDFFELIEAAITIGYCYVNTIVYPTAKPQRVAFADNTMYLIWLCKNHRQMCFDKDAIREKHIWKDVEWGKRAKNYNPKGKDPGNVWIPTLDDGKANITHHILLTEQQVIDRLLAMSACGEDHELFLGELPQTDLCGAPAPRPAAKKQTGAQVVFASSEAMTKPEDGAVQVVVTSPPYWNLKDYFKKGQIGQEPYAQYLRRMEAVWRACYRKLSPAGSLWVNINIRVHENRVVLIPHDFIKICKRLGFYYKGILIWHKSSGIPTNNKNIVDRHEYVLVFSKSKSFFADTGCMEGYCDYKNAEINGGSFWNINRKAGSVGKKFLHPAIYPTELVKRIVLATTQAGDTVLDPFLGSGTSLIAALQCGRAFVGYEYNEGFRALMESRFAKELADAEVAFCENGENGDHK